MVFSAVGRSSSQIQEWEQKNTLVQHRARRKPLGWGGLWEKKDLWTLNWMEVQNGEGERQGQKSEGAWKRQTDRHRQRKKKETLKKAGGAVGERQWVGSKI